MMKINEVDDGPSLHVNLAVGPSVIACLGIREGSELADSGRISELVSSTALNRLSILCPSSRRLKNELHIEVQTSRTYESAELSIFAKKQPRNWKVRVLDKNSALICGIPIHSGQNVLGLVRQSCCTVELLQAGCIPEKIGITVCQFTISDGIAAGLQCLHKGYLRRTLSIFEATFSLHPYSRELWDLVGLVRAIVFFRQHRSGADPEFGATRAECSPETFSRTFLEATEKQFGQPNAANLIATTLNDGTVEKGTLRFVEESSLSSPLLEALQQVLGFVAQNNEPIRQAIEELTAKVDKTADVIGEVRSVVTARFDAFFVQRMGGNCWEWLGKDVQGHLIESESIYRKLNFTWDLGTPNFVVPMLVMSTGLELLVKTHLNGIARDTRQRLKDPKLLAVVQEKMDIDVRNIPQGRFTLGSIAFLLKVSGIIRMAAKGGVIVCAPVEPGRRSALGDPCLIDPLRWFTARLRNLAVHPEGSRSVTFLEMLLARKLTFGVDEYGVEWKRASEILRVPKDYPDFHDWGSYRGIILLLHDALTSTHQGS